MRGTGLVRHHLSCRLFSARPSTLSRPTPTSVKERGMPSSRITRSKMSPKSRVSLLEECSCRISVTTGSLRRTSRTRACRSQFALCRALYLQTAGSKIQLVSPCPTPNGPSYSSPRQLNNIKLLLPPQPRTSLPDGQYHDLLPMAPILWNTQPWPPPPPDSTGDEHLDLDDSFCTSRGPGQAYSMHDPPTCRTRATFLSWRRAFPHSDLLLGFPYSTRPSLV